MERLAFTGKAPAQPSLGRPRPLPPPLPDGSAAEARLAQQDVLAYYGLLAFTFVLFVRPQDSLPFLEPLRLANLSGSFALIALVAGRVSRGAPIVTAPRELIAVVALGMVMLATAPFSIWPGGAVGVFTELYVKVIIIFALMVNVLTTRARMESFITMVVFGTSYIGVRAVIDYARGVNLIEDGRVTGAVGGLFGNPNDMALNMVAFLPLCIVVALGRGRPLMRVIALIGVPAIVAAIVFSKSRGGLVGLVAMLLVLLYQMRRVRPGVAAVVVAASLATIPVLPESFTNRMSSIFKPEEDPTGSREARKRLLEEGWKTFVANPVVGVGAGQFQNYQPEARGRQEAWRETHNATLQVAAELGAVGLIIFTLLVVWGFGAVLSTGSALRRLRATRRARAPDPSHLRREPLELHASAMVASLTGWFAAAMFASVAYYWTFYIILGLATSLRAIALREIAAPPQASAAELPARAA
jgi:putative inorganic carbon (hco3(-)) transporter